MAHNGANTPARAIHQAAQRADVDALRYALAAGTPVDVREEDEYTPLMRLSMHCGNHEEERAVACAELLLAAGANIEASDSRGETALLFAASDLNQDHKPRLLRFLLDAGANPNATGARDWTSLHWAAARGCTESVALLVQHGAAVNVKTVMDRAPLQFALMHGYRRMFPILLSAGASLPPENLCDDAYIQRVVAAGSWANYERLHLDKLTAMLTQESPPADGRRRSRRRLSPLRRVPQEVLRRIVAFAFHVGYY